MDRVRNEYITGSWKVTIASKRAQEAKLGLYDKFMKSSKEHVAREAMSIIVDGQRRKGRPKTRWMNRIVEDQTRKATSIEKVGSGL